MPATASSGALQFESHPVGNLHSVAHLFPRGKGRRGVYVLTFADDDRYVGQSVNVVTRFGSHLHTTGDIVSIQFARIPHGDLDTIEQSVIRTHVRNGVRLRNQRHVLTSTAHESGSDLDIVVTPAEQHSWLNDDADLPDAPERIEVPIRRAAGQAKNEALRTHPLGPAAIELVRRYVQRAVPRPRATEMTFWSASAMPSTNRSTWPRLVGVSVNSMETFVIGWHKHEPDAMWGFLNCHTSRLVETYGSIRAFAHPRRSWLDVEVADYEAGGGDVTRISVRDQQAFSDLLTEPAGLGVIDAARSLNLSQ